MTLTDSSNESRGKLRLLKVEPVETPPIPIASERSSPAYLPEVIAVLTAIAAVLASKFLLLLAVLGGTLLAYQAIANPDPLKIAVCAVYDVGVVLPVAYLYWRGT